MTAPTTIASRTNPARGPGTAWFRVAHSAAGAARLQPAALVNAGVHYLIVAVAITTLWTRAAAGHGGTIVGYRAGALVWYLAATEVTAIAPPLRLIDRFGADVASGRFELELLRPAPALWIRVATEIGTSLPRTAVCATAGAGLALVIGGAPPAPTALALAAPALLLGVALTIVAQHLLAAATFWLLDSRTSWFLYQKLQFTLGGLVLPLEVLPGALGRIARFTPFAAMSYAPGRLASGHLEPGWILAQVGWLAVLGLVTARVFAAGERHLGDGGAS